MYESDSGSGRHNKAKWSPRSYWQVWLVSPRSQRVILSTNENQCGWHLRSRTWEWPLASVCNHTHMHACPQYTHAHIQAKEYPRQSRSPLQGWAISMRLLSILKKCLFLFCQERFSHKMDAECYQMPFYHPWLFPFGLLIWWIILIELWK